VLRNEQVVCCISHDCVGDLVNVVFDGDDERQSADVVDEMGNAPGTLLDVSYGCIRE
jgi:hypothetical protein